MNTSTPEPEDLEGLLKLIDSNAKRIIKQDPFYEVKNLVQRAIRNGLIQKKTENEIQAELLSKPWKKVNKIIRENENRNNNTTDPSNHSG